MSNLSESDEPAIHVNVSNEPADCVFPFREDVSGGVIDISENATNPKFSFFPSKKT